MTEAMASSLDPYLSPLDRTGTAIKNVLENDLMLSLIVGGLENTSDLKSARLICPKWKQLATQILKQRNWTARKLLVFNNAATIEKYLDTFSHAKESVTFTCFKMHLWRNSNDQRYAYWLHQFFQTFPHSTNSLELCLDFCPILLDSILQSQANSLMELRINSLWEEDEQSFGFSMRFSPVNFYLPSLEYFCIDTGKGFDKTPLNTLHQLNIIETVISRIPAENKNTIKICVQQCDLIRETVALLQKYELLKSLKFLSVFEARKGDFEIMAKARTELDFLMIDFPQYYKDSEEIENLYGGIFVTNVERGLWTQGIYEYLRYQRNILKMMNWEHSVFKFPLWGMPGLKKLRLKYSIDDVDFGEDENVLPPHLQGTNLMYSEIFPNLEELIITSEWKQGSHHHLHNFQSMFLPPQLPCITLQALKIHYDGMDAQILTKISATFPRLKSLDMKIYTNMNEEEQREFYSILWNAEFKLTMEELIIQLKGARSNWPELCSLFFGVKKTSLESQSSSGTSAMYNYKNLKRVEVYTNNNVCPDRGFIEVKNGLHLFAKIEKLEYLHIDPKLWQFQESDIMYLKKMLNRNNSSTKIISLENPIEMEFETDFNYSYFSPRKNSSNLLA